MRQPYVTFHRCYDLMEDRLQLGDERRHFCRLRMKRVMQRLLLDVQCRMLEQFRVLRLLLMHI